MRRILFPVAVAAMLGAASVAAVQSTSGTVIYIDMDARTITLQNGETFALPARFPSGAGYSGNPAIRRPSTRGMRTESASR
jgi:hypothetical protein